MLPRKRPGSTLTSSGSKQARRTIASKRSPSSASIKADPERSSAAARRGQSSTAGVTTPDQLKDEFIKLFSEPNFQAGISNGALKSKFGNDKYMQLVPIINELMKDGRLSMSRIGDELFYSIVSDDVASKFSGLDVSSRMVYQVVEKGGNMGIWTKDIRTQTNIQQQALNKIFKSLENRKLIKSVKSVTNKSKKLYMLYELTPAKEITGGPWYTNMEFDHEFINELRKFILLCVKKMNGGRGVTLAEISEKMKQAQISRVPLNLEEVQQVMQTLAYDYMIEQSAVNQKGEALFVAARRVTTMCEFKWWDVLCDDFHFRAIRFEDGVTLAAHEPHHHAA